MNPALPSKRRSLILLTAFAVTVPPLVTAVLSSSATGSPNPAHDPVLVGRAVLPWDTFAGPPPAGAFLVPGPGTVNGVQFPLPAQPVEGFSAIVDGGSPGDLVAMPDNGFGGKANSVDFLIRAYSVRPRYKTAGGGPGTVEVGDFVSFRDPDRRIGFPIVREGTADRLLTGGDIDPESLQRGRRHDLWVGDEFGPWILHFDGRGRLLDPPFALPGNLMSPNNPHLGGRPATHPNSRGLEGMAISPDRKYLYAALEGALLTDADPRRRFVYEFSTRREEFTGRVFEYRTEQPGHFLSDLQALDRHRLIAIERDGGSGLNAQFRRVYRVDLRRTTADGFLEKAQVVDLAAIPDPDLVSLPPLHAGDVGLGDPFRVTCESVEAVHVVNGHRIVVGCDNNLPNSGRNPGRPDDNEFIVVDVPLRAGGG
ncbi:esterase-like activity of phytase family protein [Nocardioides guangzhouensis]|nr:esterase-like activity of phytase family protein [Nocardioides guangzhouensis]